MSTRAESTTEFRMPSLGADMTEGRVTEWLVKPGDHVERGQVVVIVETDKSDIEVEVFKPGTVTELLVAEGEKVPVGTAIAMIASESRAPAAVERASAEAPTPAVAATARRTEPGKAPTSAVATTHAPASHVTSPVLRRLADDLHVDVTHVHGSGPGGRIQRQDVIGASGAPARGRFTPRAKRLLEQSGLDRSRFTDRGVVSGDDVVRELARSGQADTAPTRAETMRQRIAQLMARSWAEIPHYHVAKRLDLSTMLESLRGRNDSRALSERVLPAAVLLCSSARAALAVPECNGWWRNGRFEPATGVRLGVVLSLRDGGIVVPTIADAHELTTVEMMVRLSELVQRARHGRLRASDMVEASITVTNLGDLGAESVYGVIHPPQVALVGFGSVHDEAWPDDAVLTIRPTVHTSLAGDHRASDGLAGSRFLAQLQAIVNTIISEES
jgi:pyruvate dehydrogenase E2 component (dihydrolipoamide acetyltransferase)